MSARTTFEKCLHQLGDIWGIEIELGSEDAFTIEFEENLTASIRYEEGRAMLHIDVSLLELHADHRPGLYKIALALSYEAFEETGVALTLNPANDDIVAKLAVDIERRRSDEVVERIADCLLTAKALHDRLQVGHEHDEQGHELPVPEKELSSLVKV